MSDGSDDIFENDPLIKDLPEKDKNILRQRRWPHPVMGSNWPKINPTWVAEYMATHELSLEVTLEHLAIKLRRMVETMTKEIEKLEGSDPPTVNNLKVFVEHYKPIEGYWAPLQLVQVIKETPECPSKLKKPLLPDSKPSSKD